MNLQGVMPALVTPFDADGAIDFAAFGAHMANLRAAGVTGWVPCGSTGEYNLMSDAERDSVLRFVRNSHIPMKPLIAGANAPHTAGVIDNCRRARAIGYDTVLLATPFYTKPAPSELISHFNAVLAATDVNVVLYSYPAKDGIELGWDVLDALADHPRVIGIKESSGVLQRAIGIATRYAGRLQLVSGSDDIALDFMIWGADSWICGPANCMGRACCDLDRSFRAGDMAKAKAQMATLFTAMSILESGKYVQKVKYGCELQGTPVGQARMPLGPLSADEKAAFAAAMGPILAWGRMMWDKTLDLLLVHAQGEIGKVLVAGAPAIPGATVLEKMDHINRVDDSLRRFLTFEPRAHVAQTVNLLLPPCRPDADAAFIVLQADRAHPMSGSNAICVVTALLETGRVALVEPETIVRLDTAAGLVTARARCREGRCLSVSLDNVPAFALSLDVPVKTRDFGTIRADIAFGGVFYALIEVGQTGLTIAPENARALAEAGIAIKADIKGQIPSAIPELPGLDEVAYVMFRDTEADGTIRTCTTLKPGRVDRSPCGTGSSANLACQHARGMAGLGDRRISRSIIGGTFTAEVLGETMVGPHRAILPRITGQAWVYGREELRLSPDDPFAKGFALSDTWGPQVGDI